MFEARLNAATTLKKVLDAIKDLLNEATFDCSDAGIQVSFVGISDWFWELFFAECVLRGIESAMVRLKAT